MRDYKSFKVILYVRQWKRTLMKLSCEILNFPGMFKWVNRKCVPYAISIWLCWVCTASFSGGLNGCWAEDAEQKTKTKIKMERGGDRVGRESFSMKCVCTKIECEWNVNIKVALTSWLLDCFSNQDNRLGLVHFGILYVIFFLHLSLPVCFIFFTSTRFRVPYVYLDTFNLDCSLSFFPRRNTVFSLSAKESR